MIMKNVMKHSILSTFGFLLLSLTVLSSCDKSSIDFIEPKVSEKNPDTVDVNPYMVALKSFNTDTLYLDCIRIPLPVDVERASGKTLTINDSKDIVAVNKSNDPAVDFVYPVSALGKTGPIVLNNVEDIIINLQYCSGSNQTNDCSNTDAHVLLFFNSLNIMTLNRYEYDIIYPVSLIVEGKKVTINSDDEYLPAVGGSPFDLLEAELEYPVAVKQFGRTIVMNNDVDVCNFYKTLDEPCSNKPAHIQFFYNEGGGTPINCTYFINYPVDIDVSGTTKRINSKSDYVAILNSSSQSYQNIKLIYPLEVTKYKGSQSQIFVSDASLCDYLTNCK
jgi:hypothetical protein